MEHVYDAITRYGKHIVLLFDTRVEMWTDPIEGLHLHIESAEDNRTYEFAISIDGSYEDPLPSGNLCHWVHKLAQDWAKFCETL